MCRAKANYPRSNSANQELSNRVEDLEAEKQRTRRKTQALEGISLLVEAAKDI